MPRDPNLLFIFTDEDRIRAAIGDPVRTIVTQDRWKYCWSMAGDDQLFQLAQDPFELEDLAHQPQHAQRIHRLRSRIERWQERTGDTVRLPH